MPDEPLSARLRSIREAFGGKTQREMSLELGLGTSSWQRWELTNRPPSGDVLEQLAARGVSLDWLFTGEGSMNRADVRVAAGTVDIGPDRVGLELAGGEWLREVYAVVGAAYAAKGQRATASQQMEEATAIFRRVLRSATTEEARKGALAFARSDLEERLERAADDPASSKRLA